MKLCKGFKRAEHTVERLHGNGLCDACYMKEYAEVHAEVIIKYQKVYQKEYRADSGYREQARIYMREYRKCH